MLARVLAHVVTVGAPLVVISPLLALMLNVQGDAFVALLAGLGNDEELHQNTRASSRSARTSSFAASAGVPVIMRVCFCFCGT